MRGKRWSGSYRRAVALVVVMGAALPVCVLGCNMLGLGQGTSSTGGEDDTPTTNANLGDFTLNLKMTQSSCGEGAAGLQDAWSFDVTLAYTGTTATWTSGGAMIQGTFNPDEKTLGFQSSVTIDMRANDPAGSEPLPACSVQRSDDAAFSVNADEHPTELSGVLTYSYAVTPNSNCADLLYGSNAQFAALPCTVSYAVTGAPRAPKK